MISLNLDHVCPHTYMRAIWGMNETFWSYAWETRYKEQAKCVGNHWIGFWMDAWEFRWFSIVVHIPSRVRLIYCLLPLNEPLPESYDLLVAWEYCSFCVCELPESFIWETKYKKLPTCCENTMNWFLVWKPESFVDLTYAFTIHGLFNILIAVLWWTITWELWSFRCLRDYCSLCVCELPESFTWETKYNELPTCCENSVSWRFGMPDRYDIFFSFRHV